MKIAVCKIKSISPLQQSRAHQTPKQDKESADDYEKRTWRERIHCDKNGEVFIPPMSFKKSVETACKYLAINIPGRGKANYTKHFKSGVLCMEPAKIGIKKDEVQGNWLFLNADGVSGSGKRVMRCMPMIPEWETTISFHIVDDTITKDVFERVLKEAGMLIGVGSFRPENGGYFGRFEVESIAWQEKKVA